MAKKLDLKVPKRIAGMKIPKAIRKGPVGNFLKSSGGQLLLAEVVLAVGAAYAARRLDPNSPTGEALRHPIDSLRAGRDWSRGASDRLARALGAGVQAFRAALHEPSPDVIAMPEEALSDVDAAGDSETARKKPTSRSEAALRETGSSGPH